MACLNNVRTRCRYDGTNPCSDKICAEQGVRRGGTLILGSNCHPMSPLYAQYSACRQRQMLRRMTMIMRGYGQPFTLPASPEEAAKLMCAAMGGQWDGSAMECSAGGNTYSLPDFLPGSMPPGPCPSGETMTPQGCKPFPGGVEPECPAGQVMTPQGCQPATTPPVPPGPPATSETKTPSWVLPVAIGGIGAIAIIALVTTK